MTILILTAVALAACSRSPASIAIPPALDGARPMQTTAIEYAKIYNFRGIPDGAQPNGDLVYSNGVFYGSTYEGGDYGAGAVFRMSGSGEEHVLHSFNPGRSKQGIAYPGGITLLKGVFYGTTVRGGAYGSGAVYQMTTAGKTLLLHSFGSGKDAREAYSGLFSLRGVLYGEAGGGAYECATIYSMTPAGVERLVYSFPCGAGAPTGGLIAVKGTLYGTTLNGGQYNGGTAFRLTTAGSFRLLHTFGATGDGSSPSDGVTALHGTLYGTTQDGRYRPGGIVFSLSKTGSEKILHEFGAGNDGALPDGALATRNGVLYGTTQAGGAYGEGTFFSITTSGSEKILHSFGNASDGSAPGGGLLSKNGTFYGTTFHGGSVCNGAGCGTIFDLTP